MHAVLSAHTASLALFETVPSYIPGIMVRDKGYTALSLSLSIYGNYVRKDKRTFDDAFHGFIVKERDLRLTFERERPFIISREKFYPLIIKMLARFICRRVKKKDRLFAYSQLILMGLFTMLLARRKHRYGLLVSIKRSMQQI